MKTKTYSELIQLQTYQERLDYLYIGNGVGAETFGKDRHLNQTLYTSPEWRRFRRDMIIRDGACDLALQDCEVNTGTIILHHLNPITAENILNRDYCIFDPENVVCTVLESHNYIHYGKKLQQEYVERRPNDTCPWKGVR